MLDQTFSLIDIPRLFTLIFLEGILSLDNALAIALIVRRLPPEKRQKALFIGVASAVILRAFGVLSAAYLIQLFWVQLLGGLYLIYLSLSHLTLRGKFNLITPKPKSFFGTVVMIELTDFVFAVDSILAGLAMIGIVFHPPNLPPKIWIVYIGGISGLILMRFAAKIFTGFIERFPRLEMGSHLIIGWMGLKLLVEVWVKDVPLWGESLFWVGIVAFFALGFIKKRSK
ncbi:MAG: hypothetical protein K1060chlam2_00900 [Chlamydiae bacterium]|nr:hypothetical protein [Chlamydiota bacterium]